MTNKDLLYSTGNSNPTPGHIPTETITGKHNMHPIVHWSTIYIPSRTWKQPKPPSTDEWIKKMRYIHITENYSAINKKNEIMPFVTKRIDIETVILSEVRQTNITRYHLYVES